MLRRLFRRKSDEPGNALPTVDATAKEAALKLIVSQPGPQAAASRFVAEKRYDDIEATLKGLCSGAGYSSPFRSIDAAKTWYGAVAEAAVTANDAGTLALITTYLREDAEACARLEAQVNNEMDRLHTRNFNANKEMYWDLEREPNMDRCTEIVESRSRAEDRYHVAMDELKTRLDQRNSVRESIVQGARTGAARTAYTGSIDAVFASEDVLRPYTGPLLTEQHVTEATAHLAQNGDIDALVKLASRYDICS